MVRSKKKDNQIRIYLNGEIDQCASAQIRAEIEQLLSDQNITHMILDFDSVSFMDSSGVGMIIGRYKTMKKRGGTLSAAGLHPPADRLFHMAGLHRIIAVESSRGGAL